MPCGVACYLHLVEYVRPTNRWGTVQYSTVQGCCRFPLCFLIPSTVTRILPDLRYRKFVEALVTSMTWWSADEQYGGSVLSVELNIEQPLVDLLRLGRTMNE